MRFMVLPRPGRRAAILILVLLFLTSFMASFIDDNPLALFVSGNLRPIEKVDTSEKVVALTFETNFGEEVPREIARVLNEKGIKATFFVSGPWAAVHPEIVVALREGGHEIGSLGYSYRRLSDLPSGELMEELQKAGDLLQRYTGHTPRYFRPPHGDFSDEVISIAGEAGYLTVIWSLDPHDVNADDPQDLEERLVKDLRPGTIVRLTASDNHPVTAAALPLIIDEAQKKGYRMVTLSDLFSLDEG